jgi:hypothetical protein
LSLRQLPPWRGSRTTLQTDRDKERDRELLLDRGCENADDSTAWQPHVTLGKVRSSSDLVEAVGKQLLAVGAEIVAEGDVRHQIGRPKA